MAAADEGTDWSLVNFARQVFGAKSAAPEVGFNFVETPAPEPEATASAPETETAAVPETEAIAVPEHDPAPQPDEVADAEQPVTTDEPPAITDEAPVAALPEVEDAPPSQPMPVVGETQRPRRTASEMADIILNALRAVDGVPERGFIITVYGSRPWNAMLTIKPEAGRIKDPQLWRQRVQDIGARLRRDFDLIDEA